ncbi:hypothetical protein [Snodgrassella alvi]|uniref:hypothetical protein n=1 Tax=Snodgrassella alvi TaxID=1196083 RepID=UPI001FD5E3A8|nr:hypothetical protein [Snodgrassella alvi]
MFTTPDKLKQFLHYACTSTLPTILNQRQDTLQHLPVNFRCAAVLMPVDWNHGNAQSGLLSAVSNYASTAGKSLFPVANWKIMKAVSMQHFAKAKKKPD